jgi:hypothetical protein
VIFSSMKPRLMVAFSMASSASTEMVLLEISAKPPVTKYPSSDDPFRTTTKPGRMLVRNGAWLAMAVRSPIMPGIVTISASTDASLRSGLTNSKFSVSAISFLSASLLGDRNLEQVGLEHASRLVELVAAARVAEPDNAAAIERQTIARNRLAGPGADRVDAVRKVERARHSPYHAASAAIF